MVSPRVAAIDDRLKVANRRSEQVLLVMPAQAGIQPFQQIEEELDDTRLLPRALQADSVVRSGIRQLLLRCSTSGIHAVACLRSPAYAGMTAHSEVP
jgi:hypothetical protein